MYEFQNWSHEKIKDISSYINDWFLKYPDGKIAIGTDSIEHKNLTKYATAIALFYPGADENYNKGAHILYKSEKIHKKYDLWTRLWKEIEYSKEVGEIITNNTLCKKLEIHIDINPDEEYASNKLFQAAVGYLKSYGYNVCSKPNSWVASCAADTLIR